MTTKPGKLGGISFDSMVSKQQAGAAPASAVASDSPPATAPVAPRRQRSAPAPVASAVEEIKMTVKLSRRDWERMQELKKTHRLGFQRAAVGGLNRLLAELGQQPLDMPGDKIAQGEDGAE